MPENAFCPLCGGRPFYSLPDIDGFCARLLEWVNPESGDKLILNASTKKLTMEDFPDQLYVGPELRPKSEVAWLEHLTYYDRFFLHYKGEQFEIDADNHSVVVHSALLTVNQQEAVIAVETLNKRFPCAPIHKHKSNSMYPLLPSSTCTHIRVHLGSGKLFEMELSSDKNLSARSAIHLLPSDIDVKQTRGALYQEEDAVAIAGLRDCLVVFGA